MNFDPKSTITPIQILQLICNNTNCFYKIIIAKLLAFNILSIALYTFENFNNIYIQGVSKKVYSWKKSANAKSAKCLNEL